MIQYSVLAIITFGLISVIICNPSHHKTGDNEHNYKIFGYVTLDQQKRDHPIKYCGEDMTKIFSHVCSGLGYNKRGDSYIERNDGFDNPFGPALSVDQSSRTDNNGQIENRLIRLLNHQPDIYNRDVRNVPHKCCQFGCTLVQIKTYCRQPTTPTLVPSTDYP